MTEMMTMGKLCPICNLLLLDSAGDCRSCGQQFDLETLEGPTKYQVSQSIRQLQRIQGLRNSGGGGSILSTLLGWLLQLGALAGVAAAVMKLDYRARPDLAGGVAVGVVVAWFLGSSLKRRGRTGGPAITDTLSKAVELGPEIARLELLHQHLIER